MRDIVICEDSVLDLKECYTPLMPVYNIYVHFLNSDCTEEQNRFAFVPDIVHLGFKKEQIYLTPPNPTDYSDAHYCIDSLEGECFKLIPRLPKERVWIVSNNPQVRDLAERLGYVVFQKNGIAARLRDAFPK